MARILAFMGSVREVGIVAVMEVAASKLAGYAGDCCSEQGIM